MGFLYPTFDFELHHVPAERHAGPDGLSWQRHTSEDSSNSEDELEADESGQFISGMNPKELEEYSPFQLSTRDNQLLTKTQLQLEPDEIPNAIQHLRTSRDFYTRDDADDTLWITAAFSENQVTQEVQVYLGQRNDSENANLDSDPEDNLDHQHKQRQG
jgi:hypothetical protein